MATETLSALADALAGGDIRVVDLTQPLSETTPVLQLAEAVAVMPVSWTFERFVTLMRV